ncbi:MAG: hypothetical protein R3E83_06710 [Burkholderiaceae bacterium]
MAAVIARRISNSAAITRTTLRQVGDPTWRTRLVKLQQIEERTDRQHRFEHHRQRRIERGSRFLDQIHGFQRAHDRVVDEHEERDHADDHREQVEPPAGSLAGGQIEDRDPDMALVQRDIGRRQHPGRGAEHLHDLERPGGGRMQRVAGEDLPDGDQRTEQIELRHRQAGDPADVVDQAPGTGVEGLCRAGARLVHWLSPPVPAACAGPGSGFVMLAARVAAFSRTARF